MVIPNLILPALVSETVGRRDIPASVSLASLPIPTFDFAILRQPGVAAIRLWQNWHKVLDNVPSWGVKLPKLTAVIEPGEDGWYIANCPELGIVSQGETPEHAEAMIKEAVELWLECADEDEIRRRLQERKVAIKELAVTHG